MTETPGEGAAEICFLLVSGFAELHLDIATEVLRIANRVAGRRVFETSVATVRDAPAVANSGRVIRPTVTLGPRLTPAALIVVAGLEPEAGCHPPLARRLRALDRRGCLLGAVDTGAVALAEAGLAGPGEVAIHWEHEPIFRKRYPGLATVHRGVVWHGRRFTCPGGLSVAEMMVELVARLCSEPLSRQVADVLYFERSVGSRGVEPPPAGGGLVGRAEALMRANLEKPLRLEELARALAVKSKTLARAFARERSSAPIALYRRLRLEHGRDLLLYGNVSVKQAAYACGFSSPAHFSSAFRRAYGGSPGRLRHAVSSGEGGTRPA